MSETPSSCLDEALRVEVLLGCLSGMDPFRRAFEHDLEWWIDKAAELERKAAA